MNYSCIYMSPDYKYPYKKSCSEKIYILLRNIWSLRKMFWEFHNLNKCCCAYCFPEKWSVWKKRFEFYNPVDRGWVNLRIHIGEWGIFWRILWKETTLRDYYEGYGDGYEWRMERERV